MEIGFVFLFLVILFVAFLLGSCFLVWILCQRTARKVEKKDRIPEKQKKVAKVNEVFKCKLYVANYRSEIPSRYRASLSLCSRKGRDPVLYRTATGFPRAKSFPLQIPSEGRDVREYLFVYGSGLYYLMTGSLSGGVLLGYLKSAPEEKSPRFLQESGHHVGVIDFDPEEQIVILQDYSSHKKWSLSFPSERVWSEWLNYRNERTEDRLCRTVALSPSNHFSRHPDGFLVFSLPGDIKERRNDFPSSSHFFFTLISE